MTPATVCPGCNGPKTRRARLCAECRRRAGAIGERVWTETHVPPPPAKPRTAIQNQIYHARCAELAQLDGGEKEEIRQRKRFIERRTKTWASERFGREISSSTELTETEMEIVLEHLNDLLDQAA